MNLNILAKSGAVVGSVNLNDVAWFVDSREYFANDEIIIVPLDIPAGDSISGFEISSDVGDILSAGHFTSQIPDNARVTHFPRGRLAIKIGPDPCDLKL